MPQVELPLPFAILCSIVTSALLTVSPLQADSITLKTGEEYEGTVLSESDTEVVMLVKVSGGITDEQTFSRDQIETLVTTPKDKVEFEKLDKYRPGADSQTSATYNLAIAAYEHFVKRYPESDHAAEAKELIKEIKEERARVAKKEVKLGNQWYSPEEIKRERYQISGLRLARQMKDLAGQGDLVGALNTFDRLETTFPGAAAYPEAVPFARSLVQALEIEMTRAIPIAKQNEADFNQNIQFTPEPEKSRVLAAHRANQAKAEAAVDQSNAKWKPFVPTLDKSITALNSTITAESTRLAAIDTAPMTRSLQLTQEGRNLLDGKEFKSAQEKLEAAKGLWAENELANRLLGELKAASEEAEKAASEAAAAEQAAAAQTPTPAPAAEGSQQN